MPVAPDTAKRVLDAIAEFNYTPHAGARGLALGRTNALGLITNVLSVPFFAPLFEGVESVAREAGYDVLIHCTQFKPASGPGYRRPLGRHNTDGLLVFAGALEDSELAYLYESGFPIVLLLQTPPDALDIPHVTFENKASAHRLVEHLIEVHGYRRIAFLQGPSNQEDSYWREMGYQEALVSHGLPVDPALVGSGGLKGSQAQTWVQKWLEEGQQVEAVFAWDDDLALEVIYAVQQAGKRVPEDLAVVGFDDIHLAHYLAPPLTTVRVPVERTGREAVQQLVRLMESKQVESVKSLPTELVIRRSCGCS
jgi:DNA-binding LacI/PurR family transcriptional regulator